MTLHRSLLSAWCLAALLLGSASYVRAERIVTLGGAVTEIVFALDRGEDVVAVDSTSEYPAAAADLPDVGYVRALSAEGILALNPSVVLASADAGPLNVIAQIEAAGVKVVRLPEEHSLDGIEAKIRALSEALDAGAAGETLIARFREDRDRAEALVAGQAPVKAVFLMSRGDDTLMAAGSDTAADAMLRLAGATNVMAEYAGYKPVSPEALLVAAPDVIVTGVRTAAATGGVEGLKAMAAVAQTPAARSGRIFVFDDLYLLGFGPRAASASRDLAEKIHR